MSAASPMVSCVMCTYGRFETVRQSATFWKYQDYPNKELVIFNTAPAPIVPHGSLRHWPIRVVNQETGATGKPFASLGEVREAALAHARGDIYVCWDDDDMFLPWHLSLGVVRMRRSGKPAWMPVRSYFSMDAGKTFTHAENYMEASVLVQMDELKRYGFSRESGAEHLPWRIGMETDAKLVKEDTFPLESYAYVWGSPASPHKTSGHIKDPDNFRNHQEASTDFGQGRRLTFVPDVQVEALFVNVYRSFQIKDLAKKMNGYLKTTSVGVRQKDERRGGAPSMLLK